jgi:hypothetical protein
MFVRYNNEDAFFDLFNMLLKQDRPITQTKLQTYDLDGQPVIKTNVPAVTYTESGYLVIVAEMPGLDKKDITVTVEDKTIIIKGSVKGQALPEVTGHMVGALIPKEDFITFITPTVRYSLEDVVKEYVAGRVIIKFPLDLDIDKPKTFTFE